MKKITKILVALSLALILALGCAACSVNNADPGTIQESYEIAVGKGYEGSLDEWVDLLKGATGEDGKSAYQLAVETKDFEGTLDEWLDSLKGEKGDKGDKGDTGRGIANIEIVGGHLYVTYTDSVESINVGRVTGAAGSNGVNGSNGEDGKGIDDLKIENGSLLIKYSDSNKYVNLGGVLGEKGDKGDDGRGVADVKVENGNLFIKYTDSSEYVDLGPVQGERGDDGTDGKDGEDGSDLKIEDIYAAAVKNGYEGSFLEFVAEYLSVESTVQPEKIISKTLLSSVAIASKFSGSSVSGGSGVIYKGNKETGEAYIITNFHVVYNSTAKPAICNEIYVFFYGTPYTNLSKDNPNYTPEQLKDYMLIEDYAVRAEYVAGSQSADIAVLKLKSDVYKNGPFRPAEMIEDSDAIYEGERSYVVGNAEGKGISATEGVISHQSETLEVTVDTSTNTKYEFRVIRTDAAVNHGNSGGGLFNKDGKLMGIVNAKTQTVTVDNMGYALPLNVVLGTVENLMRRAENKAPINDQVATNNHGYNKCLLGITVRATENIAEYDEESGLLTYRQVITVIEVSETGASKGYLLAGDVVMTVEINGVKRNITRMYQIGDTLLYAARGDVAKVTVLRGGETITVEIPLNIATYMA